MLQRFLIIALTLCSLTASAQWQQTGSKVRYVNGLGIPTKDTAAGVAADSSQILIRPADSSLYVKYKRTWMRVGGGTVSGTTNYVPKFTSSTAIGNSQIFDNGTYVGIGTTNNGGDGGVAPRLAIANPSNADKFVGIGFDNTGDYGFIHSIHRATAWKNLALQAFGGNVGIGTTSPANKVDIFTTNRTALNTVGSGLNVNYNGSTTGEFATIGFSWASSIGNNSTQWGMGMVGTNFGVGTAALNLFTNGAERMRITSGGDVGIGYTAPAAKLAVSGTTLINTNTDNGVDKLQVNGSIDANGFAQAYTAKSATYTATTGDYLIDCISGTFTVNLPDALLNVGRILIIKNSSTGTITVDGNGTQTIDGATTYSLSAQWATVQIMCDGNNWKIIAKF